MAMITFSSRRMVVNVDDGSEKGRRFPMNGINQDATADDCVEVATAIVEIMGEDLILDNVQDATTLEYNV